MAERVQGSLKCNVMDSISAIAGAAHLFLADNVVPLDPKPAMFQAMLEGWEQQQSARFLKEQTITARRRIVRRFAEFTNQYPWEWTAAEVEAFFNDLRCRESPLAPSTGRGYQVVLRLFMDFVTDARYGWAEQCDRRFGAAPVQLLHEWNTVAHRLDYEGEPGRRPLSYDEVQALFDAADGLVDAARALGRKGGLTTQRDAVLLKCVYAFGLRRREAWGLDVVDLGRNLRLRRSAGSGRCSCATARGRPAASRSGARYCWSRRWTGSSRCWVSGSPTCGRCWCRERTRRCSSPSDADGSRRAG